VLSHWLLDWISHEPDMPLVPGGARYGLGLWRSLPGTLITELLMFAAGVWLYTRATRAIGPVGRYGWPALVTLLGLGFLAAAFGEPPPSTHALLVTLAVSFAVVLGAAIAVDRQRPPALVEAAALRVV
jgi:hypothetical protein